MTHEIFQQVIFAIFAALALVSAFLVITLSNPVRCVLFLVLTFVAVAGIWLLAYAEFLALILILVYVGAVMTLFLFVVMMINVNVVSLKRHLFRYLPIGLLIVALLVSLTLTAIKPEHFATAAQTSMLPTHYMSNSQQLGEVLYTSYVYAFELAAVLLLIAIVAAIVLAHRGPRHSKQQQIVKQIMVDSKDRLRMIKSDRKLT